MSRQLFQARGSTARVLCYDAETAPGWQVRRLEAVLADLFPAGCGVAAFVMISWHDAGGAWELHNAAVQMSTMVDMTRSLYESLLANGLPMLV